jgi:hypothetical protein
MLEFLRDAGKGSDRKLRLFACGCVRRVWGLLEVGAFRRAVEAAELAPGRPSPELPLKHLTAAATYRNADKAAFWATTASHHFAAVYASGSAAKATRRRRVEEHSQAALLRDIVGNPFRPLPPIPQTVLAWNDGCVVKLAARIYAERDFTRESLGVLADALEEAGCQDADILGHLRSPGPHVRGCWAVDLLVGKE